MRQNLKNIWGFISGAVIGMQIPAQTCHPFRVKPARHSGSNLPPIPDNSLPVKGLFPEFPK